MITIRTELSADISAIYQIQHQAFRSVDEPELVDRLRANGKLLISLVAELEGEVVGHIAFSRVELAADAIRKGIGLGPLAVSPAWQRQGIGTSLTRAGIARCREMDFEFSVVLGHPSFYPRFGYVPASRFGLSCVWAVPDEAFMALELKSGALSDVEGLVRYPPEFDGV